MFVSSQTESDDNKEGRSETWIEVNDGTNKGVYYLCLATNERQAFMPANYTPATWHDGTRCYVDRGICSRCMSPMAAPGLLFSGRGTECCAFILCDPCLRLLSGFSFSSKERILGWRTIPRCRDQPACLKLNLEMLATRQDRAEEITQRAREAQLWVHQSTRKRRDYRQSISLRAKAMFE